MEIVLKNRYGHIRDSPTSRNQYNELQTMTTRQKIHAVLLVPMKRAREIQTYLKTQYFFVKNKVRKKTFKSTKNV